jgi:hypothetical protein
MDDFTRDLVCDAAFWEEIKAIASPEKKMDMLERYLRTACPPLNTAESLIEDMRLMKCNNGLTAFTVAYAKKAQLYLKLLQPAENNEEDPLPAQQEALGQDEDGEIDGNDDIAAPEANLQLPDWAQQRDLSSLARIVVIPPSIYAPAQEEPDLTINPSLRNLYQMFLAALPYTVGKEILSLLDTNKMKYTLSYLFLAAISLDRRNAMHGKCLAPQDVSSLLPRSKTGRTAFISKVDQIGFLPGAKQTLEHLMSQPIPTPEATMDELRKDRNRTDAIRFLNKTIDRQMPSPEEVKILKKNALAETNYRTLTNTLIKEAKLREQAHKATDVRLAALTKVIKNQQNTPPSTPVVQTPVVRSTATHASVACPDFLRGDCTDLSCTQPHINLPAGMSLYRPRPATNTTYRHPQNKRNRQESGNNGTRYQSRYTSTNRRPGTCWNFNSPRGCNLRNCRYAHELDSDARECKWFKSAAGCKFTNCRYSHNSGTSNAFRQSPRQRRPRCDDCGAAHETKSSMCYKNAREQADKVLVATATPPLRTSCQLCKGDHEVRQCPEFLCLSKNE